ncbi:hypothetical protein BDV96DRAFT_607880 [Lophiotrema nucula]|uniref:NACHT domain-containing protein n=1 Tax=Lophiotrema nucula TaxID=690887 RepID=A0A6A5YFM7_9PLEO|nr:hypothetical protein BDV96DRAFT_607880 [Lophiotrema nucula]
MFKKSFGFGRKGSDEDRRARFQRNSSHADGASLTLSDSLNPLPETSLEPATSLPDLTLVARPSYSESRKNSNSSRKNSEVESGPLGLNVVYTPENGHKADIVFVHGLGGTSRWTWSKHRDPGLFWPLTFLPLEPDVCLARILTFGYNANFRKAGNISTSVLDFAKDLLFDLRYGVDELGNDLNMGNVPLIFVVHSMGGLITKEAYMQGQNDPEYENIVKAISAIVFLATPHRGTNLAEVLNRILQSTLVSNSKQYVSELAKNSFTLQKLNEQFRHIAPKLDIVSFYETQPCSLGLKNARIMVLEKDSSVLGYPGETSKALNADHHDVCKFESPKDPNYITVRNVLKSILSKILSTTKSSRIAFTDRKNSRDLKALLAINDLPDTDYIFFRDQWTQGTSDWILHEEAYIEWFNGALVPRQHRVLWVHGGAATGKSVLASFIINTIVEEGCCCQYFFIRFGDQRKRTLGHLLRSISYQVSQYVPGYFQRLLELASEEIDFGKARAIVVWEKLFKSILFKMERKDPLYWVVDGLDEAEDPKAILRLLSDICSSLTPLRVLFVSRRTSDLASVFDRLPKEIECRQIDMEGHVGDLRLYVTQELQLSGDLGFRDSIVTKVLQDARSNFLVSVSRLLRPIFVLMKKWVRLAVERLNICHSRADIDYALETLPPGMDALYHRMALTVSEHASRTDKALASAILELVTCSLRVLTVTELSKALGDVASRVLDLPRSIVDLCGGFVVIDNGGNVAMVHQTAREYLLGQRDQPFRVDRSTGHKQVFFSCMRSLMTNGLRVSVSRQHSTEFLDYASQLWSTHLMSISPDDDEVFEVLNSFLSRHWLLTWVHILALNNQSRVLTQTSRHLSKFSAREKARSVSQDVDSSFISKRELLDSISTDLVKINGKFGAVLRRNPEAIYKLIAPFCPQSSSLYQLFGKAESKTLSLSGSSAETWDDCLGRMSLDFGSYASFITAAGSRISILDASGRISIFYSSNLQESSISPIKHGERIYRMEMNSSGSLIATYGYRTTKIWDVKTGRCQVSVDNVDSRPRPLAMLFMNDNTALYVGMDDKRVRSIDLSEDTPHWQVEAELEEPELEGHFLNSASHMALHQDGRLIAVAYRGHPLSAWELDGPMHIGHCWRTHDEAVRGQVVDALWHPLHPVVYGLYIEGVLFRWRPYENEVDELNVGASKLALNIDGSLFATGDVHGAIKVYTTADFELLYQLASQDTVLGITFGPEFSRFYDIRGNYGNAWEPTALMEFAEREDKDTDATSESGSLAPSSSVSINWSPRVDTITALATAPSGGYYWESQQIFASKSLMSTEQMTWSNDGRTICFSDSSKRVFAMFVTSSEIVNSVTMELEIALKASTKGPILQLLFHPGNRRVMIYTTSSICILSLDTQSVVHCRDVNVPACIWLQHPLDSTAILGVNATSIHTLTWDLKSHLCDALNYTFPHTNTDPATLLSNVNMNRVLTTWDKKHIMFQVSSERGGNCILLYVRTSDLSVSRTEPVKIEKEESNDSRSIDPQILPSNMSSKVLIPLVFLNRDRLVFLSTDFAVCILQVPATPVSDTKSRNPQLHSKPLVGTPQRASNITGVTGMLNVKEAFPLPGDWISQDCLALCAVSVRERSFLCPRNGEIVVVRCVALA